VEEIQKQLSADVVYGLSTDQAAERLRKYGSNKISPLPNPWLWKIFEYFFKGFGSILLVGGILVFISWKPLGQPPAVANLALGIVLVAVFVIQAAFNAWQDWSSSRVMASITAMLPESCMIIGDGSRCEVVSTEIVPGDTVFVKSGTKIPADVRFIQASHDLTIDRSVVTGLCRQSTPGPFPFANHPQASQTRSRPLLTRHLKITLKHDALAYREPIAFPARLRQLLWPPATRLSSDALQSLQASQKRV